MKTLIIASCLLITLAGCVQAPPIQVRGAPVQIRPVPVGVTYVRPTYAIPGPGYLWAYHPGFGWGWHHPVFGWHRGWAEERRE